MSDVVIAALIGAVVTLIGNILNNLSQRKKRAVEDAVKEERLENRLASIEHKLDTHNGYAEKLGNIQQDIAFIKGQMKGETR